MYFSADLRRRQKKSANRDIRRLGRPPLPKAGSDWRRSLPMTVTVQPLWGLFVSVLTILVPFLLALTAAFTSKRPPPLTTLRYVMYFRFYGWRHIFDSRGWACSKTPCLLKSAYVRELKVEYDWWTTLTWRRTRSGHHHLQFSKACYQQSRGVSWKIYCCEASCLASRCRPTNSPECCARLRCPEKKTSDHTRTVAGTRSSWQTVRQASPASYVSWQRDTARICCRTPCCCAPCCCGARLPLRSIDISTHLAHSSKPAADGTDRRADTIPIHRPFRILCDQYQQYNAQDRTGKHSKNAHLLQSGRFTSHRKFQW